MLGGGKGRTKIEAGEAIEAGEKLEAGGRGAGGHFSYTFQPQTIRSHKKHSAPTFRDSLLQNECLFRVIKPKDHIFPFIYGKNCCTLRPNPPTAKVPHIYFRLRRKYVRSNIFVAASKPTTDMSAGVSLFHSSHQNVVRRQQRRSCETLACNNQLSDWIRLKIGLYILGYKRMSSRRRRTGDSASGRLIYVANRLPIKITLQVDSW